MAETAQVDARENSLFEPGFVAAERVLIDAMGKAPTPGVGTDPIAVKIRDARQLQRAATGGGFSEAGFFAAHSFVVLEHRSSYRDWDADDGLTRTYFPEVESISRERLLPDHRLEIPPVANLLRRDRIHRTRSTAPSCTRTTGSVPTTTERTSRLTETDAAARAGATNTTVTRWWASW